jgi:hypothetical protein
MCRGSKTGRQGEINQEFGSAGWSLERLHPFKENHRILGFI